MILIGCLVSQPLQLQFAQACTPPLEYVRRQCNEKKPQGNVQHDKEGQGALKLREYDCVEAEDKDESQQEKSTLKVGIEDRVEPVTRDRIVDGDEFGNVSHQTSKPVVHVQAFEQQNTDRGGRQSLEDNENVLRFFVEEVPFAAQPPIDVDTKRVDRQKTNASRQDVLTRRDMTEPSKTLFIG